MLLCYRAGASARQMTAMQRRSPTQPSARPGPPSKARAMRRHTRWAPARSAARDDAGAIEGTGGSPPGGKAAGGGGGGGGDGDNGAAPAAALLAGRALETLPADLAEALAAGKLPAEVLARFLSLEKNPLLASLLRIGGFRERLLADPSFMVKVGIEVGIGVCTKLTAEYTKRGKEFNSQLDFVFANLLMALVADFMLVWLPAPTFAARAGAASSKAPGLLSKMFAGCPENAFQKVQPGYPAFTLGQRGGAVIRNGAKLLGVGIFASLLGVGVTNALLAVRSVLDPSFVPLNDPQNVAVMSVAYGTYMASSSNLRYQIVAGLIEERGIEVFFKGNPALCHALSFIIRTGNTFVGSLLWVDYIQLLGLQKITH